MAQQGDIAWADEQAWVGRETRDGKLIFVAASGKWWYPSRKLKELKKFPDFTWLVKNTKFVSPAEPAPASPSLPESDRARRDCCGRYISKDSVPHRPACYCKHDYPKEEYPEKLKHRHAPHEETFTLNNPAAQSDNAHAGAADDTFADIFRWFVSNTSPLDIVRFIDKLSKLADSPTSPPDAR